MTDPAAASVPPDVLAVFLEIQRMVNQTVETLQQSASPESVRQVSAVTSVGIGTEATVQTVSPGSAVSEPRAGAPTLTVEQISRAKKWVAAATAAGSIGLTLAGHLEDLLSLGERLLGLLP